MNNERQPKIFNGLYITLGIFSGLYITLGIVTFLITLPSLKSLESMAEADKRGEPISCEDLFRSKSILNYTTLRTGNLFDYLYESKYSFNSCKPEIEKFISDSCEEVIPSSMHLARSSGSFDLKPAETVICFNSLQKAALAITDHYVMPTEQAPFLFLSVGSQASYLVNPSNIKEVQFKVVEPSLLWSATIVTIDSTRTILFSGAPAWEQAKSDFKVLQLN